jgi:hypothetical protein
VSEIIMAVSAGGLVKEAPIKNLESGPFLAPIYMLMVNKGA